MASTTASSDAAGPLRTLIWLATAATTVTAAWLIGVSVTVLPARDPDRIGFWVLVAAALFVLAALAALHLARWGEPIVRLLAGARRCRRPWPAHGSAVSTLAGSGEFEGYLLLMARRGRARHPRALSTLRG